MSIGFTSLQWTACIVPQCAGCRTRLEILEAVAHGRPIINTSIGCEGVAVKYGTQIIIADTPTGFA